MLKGLALGAVLLAFVGVEQVQAQRSGLVIVAEAGVAFPVGTTEDYFNVGPTFGLRGMYGLGERLDLVGHVGRDMLRGDGIIGTPGMDLTRFEVGLEASLLDDRAGDETVRIRALVTVGATSASTDAFTRLNNPPTNVNDIAAFVPVIGPGEFSGTSFSGTAGLRLIIGDDSGLSASLSVLSHFSPLSDTEALQDADNLRQLDSAGVLNSAFTIPVTVSIRLPL